MFDFNQVRVFVPRVIVFVAIVFAMLIPLKILSGGYLPYDDALRHAAKAVSGKDWQDILVVREELWMDSHPGWHFFLEKIHSVFGVEQDFLVAFSIFFLFCMVVITGIVCVKFPEMFFLSLIPVLFFHPFWASRLCIGRPLLASMAWLFVFFRQMDSFDKPGIPGLDLKNVFFVFFTALVSWFHCQWYLYFFPLLAVWVSGKFRKAFFLTVFVFLGIALGALFTGHPVQFFYQTFLHAWRSLVVPKNQELLVPEFQSGFFDWPVFSMIFILISLVWRVNRNIKLFSLIRDPVFILMMGCWFLGTKVNRFWLDWGIPSFLYWASALLSDIYPKWVKPDHLKRVCLIVLTGFGFYFSCTSDQRKRWSECLSVEYLNVKEPIPSEWLPEKGGVVYCDLTSAFNWTFFKYPHGQWKYILGFEASMMPQEDLQVFYQIRQHPEDPFCYLPWVKKMTSGDRLLLMQYYPNPPDIPELEWRSLPSGSFIGRLKCKS